MRRGWERSNVGRLCTWKGTTKKTISLLEKATAHLKNHLLIPKKPPHQKKKKNPKKTPEWHQGKKGSRDNIRKTCTSSYIEEFKKRNGP